MDGDRLNTLHSINLRTRCWEFIVTNGKIPEKRSHHTATLIGNRLIVFGGISEQGQRLNDLHVLDLDTLTWDQPVIRGVEPRPRLGHSSAVLNDNVLVIFGGYGINTETNLQEKFNDIVLLQFDTMEWVHPNPHGNIPPPLYAHTAVSYADKLIVFGGESGNTYRDINSSIYIYSLADNTWVKPTINGILPPARSHSSGIIINNEFIIYGGEGEDEKLSDVYSLQLDMIGVLREVTFDETTRKIDEGLTMVLNEVDEMVASVLERTGSSSKEVRRRYKRTCKDVKYKMRGAVDEMRTQLDNLLEYKAATDEWRDLEVERIQEYQTRNPYLDIKSDNFIVTGDGGRVRLNIGGHIYDTSLATLTSDSKSLLAAMFSGRYVLEEIDGAYFIDRDGTHFRYILNYLRDDTVNMPPNLKIQRELLREAEWYQIDGLSSFLSSSIRSLELSKSKKNKKKSS
eukprot:TRINITY_DN5536_c3_g1_i2.p1 TRINITY_DN5536_c3_g1~~TRINITY_DN5536_c3_g1_i2.p1  ORF type:complete len:456 (-),score=109.47 TRINITY_DN5536_c3_g1_i2:227-1594(-)